MAYDQNNPYDSIIPYDSGNMALISIFGISTSEFFDIISVSAPASVQAIGIPSLEAIGTLQVRADANLTLHGIPSSEVFGSMVVSVVSGIPTRMARVL